MYMKCECHSCTQLREKERNMFYVPEPEKCPTPETCRTCPKDEVEEKIEEASKLWNLTYEGIERLRELVELARKK